MDPYFPYIFISNVFLTIADATIGYHAAPTLVRLGASDEESAVLSLRRVRTLLAGVVAIYMFCNCLAFFNRQPFFLLVVTGVIVLDIVAQLMVIGKMRNRKE